MDLVKAADEIVVLRAMQTAYQIEIQKIFEENSKLKAEVKELHEMVDYYTEYFDNFGYNPHTEAETRMAEENRKRQEEYRKRHEERMARIAATRKNAEGKNNPPF
jgi:transcription elongation factor Elf1